MFRRFLLTADCNAGCGCKANAMAPVCSEDGMANFFSPCMAGCQSFSTVNGTTVRREPGPAPASPENGAGWSGCANLVLMAEASGDGH